jgi:hypothetical protein
MCGRAPTEVTTGLAGTRGYGVPRWYQGIHTYTCMCPSTCTCPYIFAPVNMYCICLYLYPSTYPSTDVRAHTHTPRGTVAALSALERHCVCERACAAALCGHCRCIARTGGIYSAVANGEWPRVRLHWSSVVRPRAAGATWTLVLASAPWATRHDPASVVDAAGAVYVIGGYDGSTYYRDVWATTDGGANRTRAE